MGVVNNVKERNLGEEMRGVDIWKMGLTVGLLGFIYGKKYLSVTVICVREGG